MYSQGNKFLSRVADIYIAFAMPCYRTEVEVAEVVEVEAEVAEVEVAEVALTSSCILRKL